MSKTQTKRRTRKPRRKLAASQPPIPSVPGEQGGNGQPEAAATPPPKPASLPPRRATRVSIEVPLSEGTVQLGPGHIDVQLDRPQAETLRRIYAALNESSVRMKNEKHVNYTVDAVRWLLDEIGKSMQNAE